MAVQFALSRQASHLVRLQHVEPGEFLRAVLALEGSHAGWGGHSARVLGQLVVLQHVEPGELLRAVLALEDGGVGVRGQVLLVAGDAGEALAAVLAVILLDALVQVRVYLEAIGRD